MADLSTNFVGLRRVAPVVAGGPSDLNAILARVAGGDRAAFSGLYAATSAKLYGVALRICRDPGLAQDALQEAFLKIWTKASAFDEAAGRPMAWMVAIVRNVAIDAIRRKSEVALGMDEEGRSLIEDIPMPSEGLDPADLHALRGCLGGLEETHQRCIVLAYCEGYSRDELAVRFDRPVGTIKTWLFRGLATLKECLDA